MRDKGIAGMEHSETWTAGDLSVPGDPIQEGWRVKRPLWKLIMAKWYRHNVGRTHAFSGLELASRRDVRSSLRDGL